MAGGALSAAAEAVGRPRSRSRSPKDADRAVERAADEGLAALCTERRIPPSHGLAHARRVLAHASKALDAAKAPISPARCLAVRLAALLHDADDHKYFPELKKKAPGAPAAERYPNAARLMLSAGAPREVVEEGLRMIGLVSCSKNGNSVPAEVADTPEFLWPRWADRLEATGEVGVVRCWQYNCEVGAPLAVEGATPRPSSEDEVWALATEERFAEYQCSGGSSASMMDHYYDKLLRVAKPDFRAVQNEYLEAEMRRRAAPLVEVCLAYGRDGVVPEDAIRAMEARLEKEGAA